MDLRKGNIKTIYVRYLSAAFGSALISSIYSIVDMAMVGQYQGPDGTAALAVVAPVWNIIYSLGLLMGIGGSVLLGTARGQGEAREGQEYFSAALLGTAALAALSWVVVACFDTPPRRCWRAGSSMCSATMCLCLPVIWGSLARAWPRPSARPLPA